MVEGCRHHDRKAQRALYDAFAPMAMGVCMRYMHDREEARDLMQEGFIRVFERIGQVKEAAQLGGWIYRVMVNVCIKHYRRQMRRVKIVLSEQWSAVSDATQAVTQLNAEHSAQNTSEAVVEALQKLAPQQRVVFNLIAVEEYDYAEAAKKLRCSEVNIRVLYSRAKKELRNLLKQDIA